MTKRKEPDFMKELHKIREKLSRKWSKMTSREILESLHDSAKRFKAQLRATTLK